MRSHHAWEFFHPFSFSFFQPSLYRAQYDFIGDLGLFIKLWIAKGGKEVFDALVRTKSLE
jgi:hypothetical protein